jgi:hypothetical protein
MSISFYQEMLNNNKLEMTIKEKMKEYSNLSLAKVFEKIYDTVIESLIIDQIPT